MKYSADYRSAVAMQRVIAANVLDPNTKPSDRAQLARAWDALADRKWVLLMRPKPKPIDVSAAQKPAKANRTKPAPSFDES